MPKIETPENFYEQEQIDEAKEWMRTQIKWHKPTSTVVLYHSIILSALSTAERERDAYRKAYYNVANERTDKLEELTAVRSERDALKARCAELEARMQGVADRCISAIGEYIEVRPNGVEGVLTGSDIERIRAAILGEKEE